uniref:Import inner membrane translocase subunit Tim23-like n=1 Tax=Hirondellea gigas TaxID=1518452 RepID=A0A2P2HXC3_9CRUS
MAMDNSNSGFMGLFGGRYGSRDPSMNVPLTSNATTSQLSPYLSIDPSYLQNQPEFISLEGARPKRGRFELAFSQIGGLVMIGGGVGGVQGLYRGLQETAVAGHVGPVRRTQVLNYITKRMSGTANTLGTIAVIYSAVGCLLYWSRDSKEDSANTLLAGSLTGALYQSSGGLRRAGIGGVVGLALAGLYVGLTTSKKPSDDYTYGKYY